MNTVAADRAGNTLYADASVVPHVSGDKFASDCLVVAAAADVRRLARRLRLGPATPARRPASFRRPTGRG